MEVKVMQPLQYPMRIDLDKFETKLCGSVQFSRRMKEEKRFQVLISAHMESNIASNQRRSNSLKVSCSFNNLTASVLKSVNFHAPFDEGLILKRKSQEIEPYLSGRCIYLVGMMGSGKTTVGKVLSRELDYSFCDSDALVELSENGTSVAEIFKLYGEDFFREKETEALRELSLMYRLVVSTGGGVVTRPVNWRYMRKGVSVWLDVPLEALAQRIAAVGTDSRPLLHHCDSGNVYTEAFNRLSALWEKRGEAYANADARVSFENIAAKLGHKDVSSLTPEIIAIETLEQIKGFLKEEDCRTIAGY